MNVRFWKGTLAAFAVAAVLKAILEMWWIPANLAGIFPGAPPIGSRYDRMVFGIGAAAVITLLAAYVLCEFLEKLARAQNRQPLKHGAQFGLVVGAAQGLWLFLLPVAYNYLMVRIAVLVVSNVAAFAAAGWAYQKLDPGPIVRGEHHREYLKGRARR